MATTAAGSSAKRALKDVNVGADDAAAPKKQKTASAERSIRANDIATIKSILGDIQDPSIKAALERIVKNPTAAFPKKKDAAAIAKLTDQTIRTVQKLINEKLKWTNSFRNLRDGKVKGGRVEVVCQEAEVFERIFKGAAIKATNSKLSCSAKTDEEARKWDLPFQGKSYRYDSSHLHAPYSASLKDGTLTFSFKFSLEW